jgi:hypothetical protein
MLESIHVSYSIGYSILQIKKRDTGMERINDGL